MEKNLEDDIGVHGKGPQPKIKGCGPLVYCQVMVSFYMNITLFL